MEGTEEEVRGNRKRGGTRKGNCRGQERGNSNSILLRREASRKTGGVEGEDWLRKRDTRGIGNCGRGGV